MMSSTDIGGSIHILINTFFHNCPEQSVQGSFCYAEIKKNIEIFVIAD